MQGLLAECFGKLFAHAHKAGLAVAGALAHYVSMGPGLWTLETAMPLAQPAAGEGEMEAAVSPGGPVAVGLHGGPCETLWNRM